MIPYSWDGNAQLNDEVNFAAYFLGPELGLPELSATMVARHGQHPLIGGISRQGLEVMMEVEVLAGSADTLRAWFDAEDETPKVLVVTDEDGTNARYWLALCTSFAPTVSPYIFLAKLRIHGDVRLRSVAPTTVHWNVTSSGATTTVTNGVAGINDDAYPVITVTPNEYASGINPFRRFVAVGWRAAQSATQYPIDITNGGLNTDTGVTNFADPQGDDIRIYVDGVETDYWLNAPATISTNIWVNLSWQIGRVATTRASVGAGAITTLTVNESIDAWPASGLFMIDSEVFVYTGKVSATRTFVGVTRASRNTAAGGHSAGSAVIWLQHEIWIEYGDAGKSAYVTDDGYKPVFKLSTSTNTSWDYDEFAESGVSLESEGEWSVPRGGRWQFTIELNTESYALDHGTGTLGDFQELGISSFVTSTTKTAIGGSWSLYNPCGMTAANFQNGEFYHGKNTWWIARVQRLSGTTWTTAYTIASGTNTTWNSWSQNLTSLPSGTRQIRLYLGGYASSTYPARLECADVTVTLDSDSTPAVAIAAEETTYRLRPTITNTTTNESVALDAAVDVGQSVEIDVTNAQVTLLSDDTAANNLVTMVEGVRRWLLRLQPGANTLQYTEAGVVDVDVDIRFERRYRV